MSQPSAPSLYATVFNLLKHLPWRDVRHLGGLAWMVTGLLLSRCIALSRWVPYVEGRARFAQSTERRFQRWLDNPRIEVWPLYAVLIGKALAECPDRRLHVALDTTMLWNLFCVVQVSLVYRGRAIPLGWSVLRHPSASVAFADYRAVLAQVAGLLEGFEVVLLADRGFCHLALVRWVKSTPGWHCRIRGKRDIPACRWDGRGHGALALRLSAGQVAYYHEVFLWAAHERVHLAVGWDKGAKEPWIIVSDEPADAETLADYGRRFCIEESFLDQKSNGFQWESSRLRDEQVLNRLCFVMAVATLVLVSQGVTVVGQGLRRRVDPHWTRGLSYARIGWNWIDHALARGEALIGRLVLLTATDPEPLRASRRRPDRSRWMDDLPKRYIFGIPAPATH
jgi:hypothetical protein